MPDSNALWMWMIILMLLLLWTAIYIPYRLAFLDEVSLAVFIHECVCDSFFLLDIIINFFTAYSEKDDTIVVDHKKIACRYLKSWFSIDLIARYSIYIYIYIYSLPFQIMERNSKYNKVFRLLRIPRLYKMLKVLRLVKVFNNLKPNRLYEKCFFLVKLNSGREINIYIYIYIGLGRLMKVLVTMLFFVHLYACLWYFLAKYGGFQPECWY